MADEEMEWQTAQLAFDSSNEGVQEVLNLIESQDRILGNIISRQLERYYDPASYAAHEASNETKKLPIDSKKLGVMERDQKYQLLKTLVRK